jgi:hypothetical protein
MTPESRKRIVLVVLLGVLCLSAIQAYRSTRPPPVAAVPANVESPAAADPAQADGRIRLDLLEREESEDVGKNNLFTYGPPASALNIPETMSPPAFEPPPSSQPPVVSVPAIPPPPPIALKYQGFAVLADGTLTAVVTDEGQHFNVKAGEVLMGRFRIDRITTQSVEVEDLEFNRKQTLPLLK